MMIAIAVLKWVIILQCIFDVNILLNLSILYSLFCMMQGKSNPNQVSIRAISVQFVEVGNIVDDK